MMTSLSRASGLSVAIRRVFPVSREKVFAAWTRRQQLEQWMCKDVPSQDAKYVELDVRTGGRYVIEIMMTTGDMYRGEGTFQDVSPPERLVFTWSWKQIFTDKSERLDVQDSLVTVELFEHALGTEMVFSHTRLEKEKDRQDHQQGWEGCFEVLAKVLEGRSHV